MSAARLYLLDVEGTVAPIAFVYERLFPYARAHFESFLQEKLQEPRREFAEDSTFADLMLLAMENQKEEEPGAPRILPDLEYEPRAADDPRTGSASSGYAIPRLLEYIYWLMDRDRKSTALKSLQGKIWKSGFERGELRGELFADVPEALRRWAAMGKVAIYSSGSVEAQELLFRYSTCGDLTPLIAAYFDTRTGPKLAAASYMAIAAAIGVAPDAALFYSDALRELDAAREAGFGTRLVVREGNAAIEDARGHPVVYGLIGAETNND